MQLSSRSTSSKKTGKLLLVALASFLVSAGTGLEASATTKQGGGAFSTPKPKKTTTKRKKKTTVTKPKPKVERRVIIANYNADYRVRFSVTRDYATSPCWSGQRNIAIRNNRTKMKIHPLPLLGDVLGQTLVGSVSGDTLSITNTRGGVITGIIHRWRWSGSVVLPPLPGETGLGTVTAGSGGRGCDWNVQITRLN